MSTPRFDKNRPYGTVSPPWHKAQLHQDGCFFSAQGDFLFREGEDPENAGETEVEASAPASPPAVPAPQKAASSALDKADPKPPAPPEIAPPANVEASGDVDLAAWAKGEIKYPFFAVKKAAAVILPDAPLGNAASIKIALIGAGIIGKDEVA